MKLLKALCASVLAFLCLAASAQAPQPPEIAARHWLLYDVTADQVLASKDADARVDPSSLTHLMVAYIVFDALRAGRISLQQSLPVSVNAWKMPGPRMFIDPKMQVTVEDLLKGMLVQSGNDATAALAEGVGGTTERFVALMNEQARALGLGSTEFKNPVGLAAPGHQSTARDLALLSARLMQDFPQYARYFAIRKWRYGGAPDANDTNRNTLLFRDPSVDGLKTGHSESGGFSLIASAKRDFPNLQGRRLVAVVLGASSDAARANEAQKLLNWGYTAWEGIKLFDGGQAVAQPQVYKGDQKNVKLGREKALVVAVPSGTSQGLRTELSRPEPIIAPIPKGREIGKLKVMSGSQLLREVPLTALAPVEEAGILTRTWDAVRLWVK